MDPAAVINTLMEKNKKPGYHIGKMFLDLLKEKPPHNIFQIDAATGEEETNESVLTRSVQVAKSLRKLGLQPGDVLGLGGKNHLDLHIPYYAAQMEGLPVVGVDPYYKYDEIKNLFKLAEPKVAFCQEETRELYERAAEELGLKLKIITFDGDYTLAKFIKEFGDNEDISKYQPAEFDTNKMYAWLVSTSGTTGLAKVAAFKHQLLIHCVLQLSLFGIKNKTTKRKMGLNLSPVQWISGYYNAIAMPLLNQVKLQTSNPDDLGHIIDIINKYRPAVMMASPSMMTLMLKHEKPVDLTCFDILTLAGAKVYKKLLLDIKDRVRPDTIVAEAYGQSETIGPCLMPNPRGPVGSCGVAGPGREVKLVDPDTGDEITEPNVPGELWTRGPSFSEYYNNPEETAKAFTADGWFKTGDLLYRDEIDHFYFVDRIKMLIKYRNYHINPNEVEEVINKLEDVLEVCVIGISHLEDGQHAVACVVRNPGSSVSAQDIKDIVAENLSHTKQLRGGVIFLDSLPKTSTGKVARAKLTALTKTANRE